MHQKEGILLTEQNIKVTLLTINSASCPDVSNRYEDLKGKKVF